MASRPASTLPLDLKHQIDEYLESRVTDLINQRMAADPARNHCRIIASKGTLDMAYPPLILASTAAALGMDTAVFFTFYGLEILRKDLTLKVDPIGNPAMPMPVPNLIAALPGMRTAATYMMGNMFKQKGVPSIGELRDVCVESGVRMVACQMTFDVMGYKSEQMMEGLEYGGAAAFLAEAAKAHTTLFI